MEYLCPTCEQILEDNQIENNACKVCQTTIIPLLGFQEQGRNQIKQYNKFAKILSEVGLNLNVSKFMNEEKQKEILNEFLQDGGYIDASIINGDVSLILDILLDWQDKKLSGAAKELKSNIETKLSTKGLAVTTKEALSAIKERMKK